MVDKDRIQGAAGQAKGKVKEVVGKVTGDSKLEGEGKAQQVAGKVQNTVGGVTPNLHSEFKSQNIELNDSIEWLNELNAKG